ncbi:MAG: c-type cytochrome [Lacibacter sp.]|jgi:hypothetical protein
MKLFLLFQFTAILASFFPGCKASSTSTPDKLYRENRPVVPLKEDPNHQTTGWGRFKDFKFSKKIDSKKAAAGAILFNRKCSMCHRLTEEVITGPGLKNATQKHHPSWILNLLTNTSEMLNKDPYLLKSAEVYQSRMPDLQINDEEAISILEFLRTNDAKQ